MTSQPNAEIPDPSLTDTVKITRRVRREEHQAEKIEKLPKVPESLMGRVICAHPEIITALAALGMSLIFVLPSDFLTVAAAIAVVCFAFGWAHLAHLPAPRASFILLTIFGVLALLTGRIFEDFSIVAEVVGLGVIGVFIAEMLRSPRQDLLNSAAGNAAGILIVSTAGAWVMLESEALWYFLLVPGAVTLIGGCIGMAMSANWQLKWRVFAGILFSVTFGLAAGAAILVMEGTARDQMVLFAGGHLPSLTVALVSGLLLGVVYGIAFSSLTVLFSGDLAPSTVSAAVSQAFIPVLAASVPLYILARLLVGEGPTLA